MSEVLRQVLNNSNQKISSRKATIDRPPKPYKDFPLGPANNGCWQKKIRSKIHYFGRWGRVCKGKMTRIEGNGWKPALKLYQAQRDDLFAGRTPRLVSSDGLTVRDLCNRFLTAKKRKRDSGEITSRTFQEYRATTDRLVSTFGNHRLVDDLAADDFESLRADIAKVWGPVRLGNEVTRIRSVFKYAIDNGLIERPVRYGSKFQKPGKAVLRKHKAKNGKKLFETVEIRELLDAESVQLRAMIFLGVIHHNHRQGALPFDLLNVFQQMVSIDPIQERAPRPGRDFQIEEHVRVLVGFKQAAEFVLIRCSLMFVAQRCQRVVNGGDDRIVEGHRKCLMRHVLPPVESSWESFVNLNSVHRVRRT